MHVLNILFHAFVVSRIVYALPAFYGFLSEYNRSRINVVISIQEGRRWSITDLSINIEELLEASGPRGHDHDLGPQRCCHSCTCDKNAQYTQRFQ